MLLQPLIPSGVSGSRGSSASEMLALVAPALRSALRGRTLFCPTKQVPTSRSALLGGHIAPSRFSTTPSLGAPPLLNQEGWRAERRGGYRSRSDYRTRVAGYRSRRGYRGLALQVPPGVWKSPAHRRGRPRACPPGRHCRHRTATRAAPTVTLRIYPCG